MSEGTTPPSPFHGQYDPGPYRASRPVVPRMFQPVHTGHRTDGATSVTRMVEAMRMAEGHLVRVTDMYTIKMPNVILTGPATTSETHMFFLPFRNTEEIKWAFFEEDDSAPQAAGQMYPPLPNLPPR